MSKLLRGFALPILLIVFLLIPAWASAQSAEIESIELRVMTFNIWVGGKLVDFGKVAEAITAADADVVLLQEAGGNTRAIADLLDWPYVSERMQVISRYPLIDPVDANRYYIYVQTYPGQVFAVSNVHLPSDPYGPYLVRDEMTLDEVLQNEADLRMPALEEHLDALAPLFDNETPLILAGDFNTPSHLDWTDAVIEQRPELDYTVKWPVTVAVEDAGLVDTYRTVYPDPVERPGITWSYGYPYPRLDENEVIDRIDLMFASPDIEILNSEIVGPGGSPDVDIPITPYPSDHRAVVSTLRITSVEPPLYTSLEHRVVHVGEPIVVRYHVPVGEESDRTVLVPADVEATGDDVLMSLPPMEADFFGAVTFGSWTLEPGAYDAVAISAEGEEYARARFWVLADDAVPNVSTDKASYDVGEAIEVSWENMPDNRWDWVGVYAAGDPDLYNYLGFVYTNSVSTGSLTLTVDDLGELEPGDYIVRVMEDDWYSVMAEAEFTIGE